MNCIGPLRLKWIVSYNKKQNMDGKEDFISFPMFYNSTVADQTSAEELFSNQSEQHDQQAYQKDKWRNQQFRNEEEIEDQLLTKMSQLHESLRNKKLLEFELIQAEIMKKQNQKDSNATNKQIQKLKTQLMEVEIENKSNHIVIKQLQNEIEQQKAYNRKHFKKIEEVNYAIMAAKQKKDQIMQKDYFKENINSENRFISVENIRLAAENQSKQQMISQIKLIIGQMKSKVTQKQKQHKQIEAQYQLLLTQIKKQQYMHEKRNKTMLSQQNSRRNTIDKKIKNLSVCQDQQSTQCETLQEISKSAASISRDLLANRKSHNKRQSLLKPTKVLQIEPRSVTDGTNIKKKEKIKLIR